MEYGLSGGLLVSADTEISDTNREGGAGFIIVNAEESSQTVPGCKTHSISEAYFGFLMKR